MRASIARLFNRDAIFVTLVSAGVALVAGLGLLAARAPAPLIVMELRTEVLSQRVARPELSALPLVGAEIARADACTELREGGRFTGVARPPEGSVVTYRWQPDALLIEIVAAKDTDGVLLSDVDERECTLPGPQTLLRLKPAPRSVDHAWLLPIAGPAQAGSEIGTPLAPRPGSARPFDLLRDGKVEVFGRSIIGGELFPAAGASYVIPAGSRVASAEEIRPGTDPIGASWYGAAFYEADGLHVSATTETGELRLFRPGPGDQREVFGLGLLASILGDPALGTLAFATAVFFSVIGLVSGWMSLYREPAAPFPEPLPAPADPAPAPPPPAAAAGDNNGR